MSLALVELKKLVGLRPALACLLVTPLVVGLLTLVNARTVRGGHTGASDLPLDAVGVGQYEAVWAIAAVAALGAIVFWQEWRPLLQEAGGSRQSTSTRLAMPRMRCWWLAKLAVVVGSATFVMTASLALGFVVARVVLGEYAEPMTRGFWQVELGALLYGVLTALMSSGLTLALRNGLVPVVWLVANSTVISVGYLLALRWRAAWYLPDTVGTVLVRTETEAGMPSRGVAALVMVGWALLASAAGYLREKGRDE